MLNRLSLRNFKEIEVDISEKIQRKQASVFLTRKNLKKVKLFIDEISKEINKKNIFLSLNFINDKEMKGMNKTFKDKNESTNILAFPFMDVYEIDRFFLGDIFINYSFFEREHKMSLDINKEFISLLIHSTLHLIGYTHNKDIDWQKMLRREEELKNLCKI